MRHAPESELLSFQKAVKYCEMMVRIIWINVLISFNLWGPSLVGLYGFYKYLCILHGLVMFPVMSRIDFQWFSHFHTFPRSRMLMMYRGHSFVFDTLQHMARGWSHCIQKHSSQQAKSKDFQEFDNFELLLISIVGESLQARGHALDPIFRQGKRRWDVSDMACFGCSRMTVQIRVRIPEHIKMASKCFTAAKLQALHVCSTCGTCWMFEP